MYRGAIAAATIIQDKIVRRDTWAIWRGSPELLAQLARVAARCVDGEGGSTATCTIDIEVAGDHEVFYTVEEFVGGVTTDALRHFKVIEIAAVGERSEARFRMNWRRAWWAPGKGNDAEVSLEITASSEAFADAALKRIVATVKRGKATRSNIRQTLIAFAAAYVTTLAVVVAVLIALYLLKVNASDMVIGGALAATLPVGLLVGAVIAAWLYPSLEVAQPGQTHFERLVKFMSPLIVALALTGIGKALYG